MAQNTSANPRKSLFQGTKQPLQTESNPYLGLAKPIFKHIDTLLHTYEVHEIKSVQDLLKQECDYFVNGCTQLHLEHSQIMIVRYLLCTFIDEMVCTTYWGKEHNWAHESLLNFYYQETYGGEKFFQLMAKMLTTPANNLHVLELMYLCIALGFEGKYRIQPKGKMELDAIRENLYKQIRTYQGRETIPFYTNAKPSSQNHHFFYKVPYLKLVASSIALLIIAYTALSIPLIQAENLLISQIESLSLHQNSLTASQTYAKN